MLALDSQTAREGGKGAEEALTFVLILYMKFCVYMACTRYTYVALSYQRSASASAAPVGYLLDTWKNSCSLKNSL